MKRMKLIYALAATLLVCSGCADFLEEHDRSAVTTEGGYYDTEKGFESLVNSCYTPLRFWGGKSAAMAFSETGTDILAPAGGCDYPAIVSYQNDFDGTNPISKEYYDRFYKAINFCNTAVSHVKNVPFGDKALTSKREAEVRFLRAYYYWILAETFGDTYYTDQPSESIIMAPKKTSVAEIYTHIFEDLDFCIDSRLSVAQSDGGRVTLWAAKALKARLLLTRASELKDNALYDQAYTLAKEVIDKGPFELSADFASVFDMAHSDGNGNKEVIWYVDYSSTNQLYNQEMDNDIIRSGGNHTHLIFCMKYDDQPGMVRSIEYGRPFNHYMPTRYLLDCYDAENDQRFEATFRSLWKANGGKPGDKYPYMVQGDTAIWVTKEVVSPAQREWAKGRYQVLDRTDIYNEDGSVKSQKQYMPISKFEDPTRATVNEDRGTRDAFMIRLAEMYLIVAEAGAKTGKADALNYLNVLRAKRAKPGKEETMKVTQADMENIDFILDERARELVGEQLRWFDLKRMGSEIFLRRIKMGNPDAGKNVKEHHALRPFPQTLLDAITNKNEFLQNEGYK